MDQSYMHIYVDLENTRMIIGNDQDVELGKSLRDFIYFPFPTNITDTDEEELKHYIKDCHPYFLNNDLKLSDLDELKKIQRKYFHLLDQLANGLSFEEIIKKYIDRSFGQLIAGMKIVYNDGVMIDYLVMSFEDCLIVEFYEMIRHKFIVKYCKNCNKMFMPKKSNIDYCDRVNTVDGKSCAQVGYAKTYAKFLKQDDLLQAYTKAYKAHYARMSKPRKKAENMSREAFEIWYHEAKGKLDLAREGRIDTKEFLEWLKK